MHTTVLSGVGCSDGIVDVDVSDWWEKMFFAGVDVPAGEKQRHGIAVFICSAVTFIVRQSSVTVCQQSVLVALVSAVLVLRLSFEFQILNRLDSPTWKASYQNLCINIFFWCACVSSLAFWTTADGVWHLFSFTSLAYHFMRIVLEWISVPSWDMSISWFKKKNSDSTYLNKEGSLRLVDLFHLLPQT